MKTDDKFDWPPTDMPRLEEYRFTDSEWPLACAFWFVIGILCGIAGTLVWVLHG